MIPLAQAPRVYLDTALLCDLADGRDEGDTFRGCWEAMRAAGAALIFGPAHMMDLHRGVSRETRDRVFGLVDRFPRVATVQSSPPLSGDSNRLDDFLSRNLDSGQGQALPSLPDLVLSDAGNSLRKTLEQSGYDEADWIDTALQGEILSREASGFRASDQGEMPRDQRRLLEETFAMAMRRQDSVTRMIEGSVHPRLRNHAEVLASEARLRALDQEFAPVLQTLGILATATGGTPERLARRLRPEVYDIPVWWSATPNGVDRWLAAARRIAPGLYLKAVLLWEKNLNSRRPPRPSDNADQFHVALVPFMDIVTLDKENLAIVRRHTRELRVVRRATLLSNGDLASLVLAAKALSPET